MFNSMFRNYSSFRKWTIYIYRWSVEENQEAHKKDAYLRAEEYLSDYYTAIKDKDVEVVFYGEKFTTEDVKEVMVNYIDGRYMSRPLITNMIQLIMYGDKQISEHAI